MHRTAFHRPFAMKSSPFNLARAASPLASCPRFHPAQAFLALLLSTMPTALGQTITWDGGGGDLDWNNRLNWSGDAIPDAANDVVIDVAPGATVLCPSGARIKSVQCNANLLLSGGTLTVTAGISAIEGRLTVASGASVVGSGPDVHLRAIGGGQIDGASLQAYAGAVVEVPGIGQVNAHNSMSWLAEGAGSRLILSGLTNLIGASSPWFRLSATSGGRLELTNLASIPDGYVAVYAEGDNSVVDLSAVESFQPTNGQMTLTAYNNGAIRMPLVTDGRAIQVDRRSGGQIPVTQYFRLGSFTQFGGTTVLSGLTSLESLSGLYAYAGAVVEVPGISQVNAHSSMSWLAEGAGSRLILSGLTNLIGATSPWFRLSATSGGRLELTNLASIPDGYVAVYAEGDNSVVDLSAVESFQPINGQMTLTAYNNGAIRMPLVTDGRAIQVDRRSGGQIPVTQYFRLGNFTQFGGTAVLSGLTSLESLSGLYAYAGAVVEVPGISQVNAHSSMSWLAEGAGSRLILSGLTNLIGATSPWFRLSATSGGRLELTNLVSISDGYVAVYAEGHNSVVDMHRLSGFVTRNGQGQLSATSGGTILLNAEGWLTANLSINLPAGHPLLPPVLAATPALTVHGRAWRSYWVETRDSRPGSPWAFVARVPLTNDTQKIAEISRANTAYRIREFVADEPILDLRHVSQTEVQLILYGTPGRDYEVQSADSLDSPTIDWDRLDTTGSMTNSFRIFESFAPSEPRQFHRGSAL